MQRVLCLNNLSVTVALASPRYDYKLMTTSLQFIFGASGEGRDLTERRLYPSFCNFILVGQ
jgi:hypothetical protein